MSQGRTRSERKGSRSPICVKEIFVYAEKLTVARSEGHPLPGRRIFGMPIELDSLVGG
jgi:hypothetical protein